MKAFLRLLAFGLGCASAIASAQPVAEGSDAIDRALARLVPVPYAVVVDPRIPPTTVLSWANSPDWMIALRQATHRAGLLVNPQFARGVIELAPGTADAAITPATAAAPANTTQSVSARPTPTPSAVPPSKQYMLVPGKRLDLQFAEWVKGETWELLWSSDKSWIVPGKESVVYTGSVDAAIETAVRDLFVNGLPVRLEIWEGNKFMEIKHAK